MLCSTLGFKNVTLSAEIIDYNIDYIPHNIIYDYNHCYYVDNNNNNCDYTKIVIVHLQ